MNLITNFFENIFASDYFGIILFCVIAVLILLFIITLFFGLTDTKDKDKKKELEKDLFLEDDEKESLDIPASEIMATSNDDENIELPKIRDDEETTEE